MSAYTAAVLADTPVVYWRLGESSGTTAVDEMGLRNLTYQNTPTLGATSLLTGDPNTAVTFTAAQSESADGADTGLPSGNAAWSIECWVKTTSTAEMGLVGWGQDTGGAPAKAIFVGLLTGRLVVNSAELFNQFGTTQVHNGAAHLLDWTWDGTTMLAYIDGSQVGSGYVPGDFNITLGIGQVLVGRRSTSYFGGTMDEVAIYASKLSAARVAAHFAAASVSATPRVQTVIVA